MEEAIVETKKTGLRYALKALFQNAESEIDLKELEEIENVQKALKKGKRADYVSNIKKEDFIEKVNVKPIKAKQTRGRKKKDIELEK